MSAWRNEFSMNPSKSLKIFLGLSIPGLAGCDHSLDSISHFQLGVPESAVFGFNDQRQIMVVFSDLPQLCPLLHDTEPPAYEDFWVMSVWTIDGWRLEEEISSLGYTALSDYGQLWEFPDGRGSLEIFSLEDDLLQGRVDMDFEGSGVRARFDASWCDAALFQGMGE